jgi:hypothetical protein
MDLLQFCLFVHTASLCCFFGVCNFFAFGIGLVKSVDLAAADLSAAISY